MSTPIKKRLRLTYSGTDGLWLHVKSPSGKSAGINLTDCTKSSIAKAALMEVATKAGK